MRWFWGFLLILIGILYLGNNLAWWPPVALGSLWAYWPLLLVIIGFGLITRRWRFGYLIMILVILLSGGFIFYTKVIRPVNVPSATSNIITTEISDPVPTNIKKAKIKIDSGVVKLNISGSTDKLVEGNYKSNIGTPKITQQTDGDTLTYTIKTDKSYSVFGQNDAFNELSLSFSDTLPIELEIDAKTSDINLDLEKKILDKLTINSGASAIKLKLGDKVANNASISIKSLASNLEINVPKTLGTDLAVNAPLSSSNLDNLTQISRGHYQTDNFTTAEKKAVITINAGASSINFSTY